MPMNFSGAVLRPSMTVFARSVTYTPPSGSASAQRGVFDRAHEVIQSGVDGAQYSTVAPMLGIRLAEWSVAPVRNGVLVIDADTYKIFDVQPDGQGGAKLILKKQAAA